MRILGGNDRLVLVSYDISSDKKRTRIYKILSFYGEPVQKSVFECLFRTSTGYKRLREEISNVELDDGDSVRFYTLGSIDSVKREVLGTDRSVNGCKSIIV